MFESAEAKYLEKLQKLRQQTFEKLQKQQELLEKLLTINQAQIVEFGASFDRADAAQVIFSRIFTASWTRIGNSILRKMRAQRPV